MRLSPAIEPRIAVTIREAPAYSHKLQSFLIYRLDQVFLKTSLAKTTVVKMTMPVSAAASVKKNRNHAGLSAK